MIEQLHSIKRAPTTLSKKQRSLPWNVIIVTKIQPATKRQIQESSPDKIIKENELLLL